MVNLTSGAISSTFDSYPGDEVYYLGNTYLPNQAGPITKWTYYPWTSMASGGTFAPFYSNGTIGHIFDQRRSDGWLGLKNDLMENVLAWNDSTSPGFPNPQIVGGQARKPYMIGANDQFGQIGQIPKTKATPFPAAGAEIRHTMLLQHSNSYLLWRVQNSQGQSDMTNKAYQASLICNRLPRALFSASQPWAIRSSRIGDSRITLLRSPGRPIKVTDTAPGCLLFPSIRKSSIIRICPLAGYSPPINPALEFWLFPAVSAATSASSAIRRSGIPGTVPSIGPTRFPGTIRSIPRRTARMSPDKMPSNVNSSGMPPIPGNSWSRSRKTVQA